MKKICLLAVLAGLLVFLGSLTSQAAEKITDLEKMENLMSQEGFWLDNIQPKDGPNTFFTARIFLFSIQGRLFEVGGIFTQKGQMLILLAIFENDLQSKKKVAEILSRVVGEIRPEFRNNSGVYGMLADVLIDSDYAGPVECDRIKGNVKKQKFFNNNLRQICLEIM